MRKVNFILSLIAVLAFSTIAIAQQGDYPLNAEPGKCYAKCMIADRYETQTEQVLVKDVTYRTEVIPAQYETVTEQV